MVTQHVFYFTPKTICDLSDSKREQEYEAQYNLPVEPLGGERGIRDYINRQKSAEEIEAMDAAEDVEVPFQSDE